MPRCSHRSNEAAGRHHALGRAGLVAGYLHLCRRKGCRHREEAKDKALRLCPKCRFKLWPQAVPRPMRFHDLRGTTATLLARSGVNLVIAQRILRHSDPRLTANIYSRVDLADLQAGIDRLGIPGSPAAGCTYSQWEISLLVGERAQYSGVAKPRPTQ